MDESLRRRIEAFIQPLYQDLDGVSRAGDIRRIEAIARTLYRPASPTEEHHFTLLLLFSGLERWLGRMGNLSRASLVIGDGVSETDLRRVAESLRHLESPRTPAEKAVAAAGLIDAAGARGLVARFAAARREGTSPEEIVQEELASAAAIPEWLDERALDWIARRSGTRASVCRMILRELELDDDPAEGRLVNPGGGVPRRNPVSS